MMDGNNSHPILDPTLESVQTENISTPPSSLAIDPLAASIGNAVVKQEGQVFSNRAVKMEVDVMSDSSEDPDLSSDNLKDVEERISEPVVGGIEEMDVDVTSVDGNPVNDNPVNDKTGLSDISSSSSDKAGSSGSPVNSVSDTSKKKTVVESDDEDEEMFSDEEMDKTEKKQVVEEDGDDEDYAVEDEDEDQEEDEFVPSEEEEEDDDEEPSDSEEEYGKKKGKRGGRKSSDRLWELDPELYQVRRSGRSRSKPTLYDEFEEESSDDSYGKKKKKKKGKAAAAKGKGRPRKNEWDSNFSTSAFSSTRKESESDSDEFVVGYKKKKSKLKSKRKPANNDWTPDSESLGGVETAARFSTRVAAANVSYKDDDDYGLTDSDELMETPVYTPLPEDENVETIEKVLQRRPQRQEDGTEEFEYYIKWMRKSYLHCTWHTEEELNGMEIKGLKKLSNFIKKEDAEDAYKANADRDEVEFMEFQDELNMEIIESYKTVERVIDLRECEEEDGTQEVYCKWQSLPYSECTWERMEYISKEFQHVVDDYLDRESCNTRPNQKNALRSNRPKFVELKKQPAYLGVKGENFELRDYQLEGLNWLAHSWCRGNSSILADEMGLGKTIQTISFCSYLFHTHKVYGPFIIVVPLSTITAWQRELVKWAPDMNSIMYLGDNASRQIIREKEFYEKSSRKLKFNCLLTTFEIVLMDRELLGEIRWVSLLVDEAHRLKNSESQLHQVLYEFKTNHRLLITGTPLQNSLKELYALLVFIMPNYFPPWEAFEAEYQNLESQESVNKLHKNLEPFLLRRVKKDVEKSLPPKTERILRVGMSELQKQYYKYILTKNYKMLSKGTGKANLLNIMVELKKCCNHPDLIVEPEFHYTKDSIGKLISSSGKLKLLDKLLVKLKETGHRVLIFSQMVKMLDVLEEYLMLKGYYFQRLDGSIRGERRKQAMDQFNAPDSRDFCFLLSTRAGGLGINLATADTVIIFDSDWNPQNDLQAEARAHRIGQKNVVNIYRLVTMHSVEETVIERAKKKMVLDHVVIQRMDTTGKTLLQPKKKQEVSSSVPFDKDELDAIMKFGAENLFKEKDDEGEKNDDDEMDIDDILSRAEVKEGHGEASKNDELLSQFKVANFRTEEEPEEKGWDEIIPENEKAKIEEEEKQKQAMELFLPPRKRRAAKKVNVGYDDGDDEEKRGKGRVRSSRKAPVVERPADGSFQTPEIRALIRAVRKWGLSEENFTKIMSECNFPAYREESEIREFSERMYNDAKMAVQQFVPAPGSKKKTATINVEGVPLSCNDFVNRIEELKILDARIKARGSDNFRAAVGAQTVKWDCKWGQKEDGMLLVGVYFHGFGSWDEIRLDDRLGLDQKISLDDGTTPQATHLSRRADQLLKLFRVEEEKKAVQKNSKEAKPKKAKKEKKKKKKESKKRPPPTEGVRKSKRVKKANYQENEDEDSEDDEEQEEEYLDPEILKVCKNYMRPVKKTLLKIDGLQDEARAEGWAPAQKIDRLKQYLVIVGDHIEEVIHAYIPQHEERKVFRGNLWIFTTHFSKIKDPKYLKRVYRMTKQKDEKEGDKTDRQSAKEEDDTKVKIKISVPKDKVQVSK